MCMYLKDLYPIFPFLEQTFKEANNVLLKMNNIGNFFLKYETYAGADMTEGTAASISHFRLTLGHMLNKWNRRQNGLHY